MNSPKRTNTQVPLRGWKVPATNPNTRLSVPKKIGSGVWVCWIIQWHNRPVTTQKYPDSKNQCTANFDSGTSATELINPSIIISSTNGQNTTTAKSVWIMPIATRIKPVYCQVFILLYLKVVYWLEFKTNLYSSIEENTLIFLNSQCIILVNRPRITLIVHSGKSKLSEYVQPLGFSKF